jgi:UDP-glucuronate decarboxylase
LFTDYQRQHGLRIRIARIFNTYGPRMDPADGRVVSNFAMQALAGKPLTVYGDGTQTRAFCYVADMIDGFIRLMEAPDERISGPVNLGNPEEISMLECARSIIAAAHSASSVEFKPLPIDDPAQRCPDIQLARRSLGWEPTTSLSAGLEQTLAYFRQRCFGDSAAPKAVGSHGAAALQV